MSAPLLTRAHAPVPRPIHAGAGAHNTLSQYWVVSLLMALRALESDCFGSPCSSHNVGARLHRPLMARAAATAALEAVRPPVVRRLWTQARPHAQSPPTRADGTRPVC